MPQIDSDYLSTDPEEARGPVQQNLVQDSFENSKFLVFDV
jgi:hypothetical protein